MTKAHRVLGKILFFILIGFVCILTTVRPGQAQTGNNRSGGSANNGRGGGLVQSIPDGIVAKVNDEVIFASEVMKGIRPRLEILAKRLPEKQFRQKSMQLFRKELANMVQRKVVMHEAREKGISVSDKEFKEFKQRRIEEVGSKERFRKYLKQIGRTMERWEKDKRGELLTRKLVSSQLFGAPTEKGGGKFDTFVSPREMRRYYKNNRKEFYKESEVDGVLLKYNVPTDQKKKEQKKMIEELLRQVRNGADFSVLADLHAQEPFVTKRAFQDERKGSFPRIVETYLFEDMEKGSVEGPVEKGEQLYVLKLDDRSLGKQSSFTEVKSEIRKNLRSRKINENLQKFRKQLMEEAYIWPRELLEIAMDQ